MILVTGGSGLTGGFVARELVRRGHAVRVLARRPVSIDGVEIVAGDLADRDALARAAHGTSGIVHTACTYTDAAVDLAAMEALLAGRRRGPFVYLSSLDVYGLTGSGAITEATPPGEVHNDYSRGKLACERLLAAAGGEHVALRAPYIWGPHPTAHRRLVTARLRDGLPIVLPGTDAAEWSGYRDAWVDVRDLATIVAASLERPAGGALNVATGSFSWHDLHAALIRLTGSASAIVHKPLAEITDAELPNKQLYAQTWEFSEARLAAWLGPIPRHTFEDTVSATVAACR